MSSKIDYLLRLQATVSQLHNCGAVWRGTVILTEVFGAQTIWHGAVEVFDLTGHPEAKRCYGWSHRGGENDEGKRLVVILKIPPVFGPASAVRASILNDAKSREALPLR